jgi:hypothetical protein
MRVFKRHQNASECRKIPSMCAELCGRIHCPKLLQEQYAALKQAIENWREAQEILHQMQALSREVIFGTLPNPPRRKCLGKKVLDLN